MLETANVKLAVMAVDVLGKSGREALCFRQTPRLVGRGPSRQQAKQGQAGETAKLPKTSHIRGRSNTRVAWALAHTKDIYLPAFYHRMARRQGKQETITALAHNMLAIRYHIL